MDELSAHLQKIQRPAMVFLSALAIGWIVLPDYRPFCAGLFLGGLVSFINSRYLAMKVRQAADAAAGTGRKKMNLGFLTRASLAVLVVFFSLKSNQIHLISTIVGFFLMHLVTLLLGVAAMIQKTKK
ncbi:ATP synthase subunit I [Paenibacillus sp. y28]|uniref:ATP synthase subunit I n=1 Tax=Paenibacillus sp. y28 TaxID=3129110 RepID=UPI0030178071